jgi:hypothetical protein
MPWTQHAGGWLALGGWFLAREIICLFQQVIGKLHQLCPSLFPKSLLFGHAPEIVVGEKTHARKIQPLLQLRGDLRRYLAKPGFASLIRQQDAEEYGLIATPIPSDVVPNVYHLGGQQAYYFRDCGIDLRLPVDG